MRDLFKKKISWEHTVLWLLYTTFFVFIAVAYVVIKIERDNRQEECDNKHGILIQAKTGEFYCVREKAIIK